jgi:hypothetical protein
MKDNSLQSALQAKTTGHQKIVWIGGRAPLAAASEEPIRPD